MDASATLDVALDLFRRRFGRRPPFAAATPGRVNLIGEHTDYNQGFVLPIAIERRTIILAAQSESDRSTFFAADLDQTFEVDLTHAVKPVPGSPATYLLGVARQFQRIGHALPNLDLLVSSTIPIGAGLGSSAAVEVAFATLLEQVTNITLDPLEKALLCQRAEHEFAGTPCGIMDMYISAAARAGHAMLLDCRNHHAQHVPFPPAGTALLVVDTGVKHTLATSAYADRRAACESVVTTIGNPVRDVTPERLAQFSHALSADDQKRALHVISENTRTVLAATALASGEVAQFGDLMFQSHASLRDLYKVSCAELDALVEAAQEMRARGEGVYGARMTGGGFGGCAIVLCRASVVDHVQERLSASFTHRFGRAPAQMFTTTAAGAAHPLSCAG